MRVAACAEDNCNAVAVSTVLRKSVPSLQSPSTNKVLNVCASQAATSPVFVVQIIMMVILK
jgi:hypothetical protein